MIPELTTKRLVLNPFTLNDAPDVQRLAGDEAVSKLTSNVPYPYLDGMAEDWISGHVPLAEAGRGLVWAIRERQEGGLVGAVSLVNMVKSHQAELGFWLGRPFWGRGYMTEAGQAVLGMAFERLKLKRVHASHYGDNLASARVLEKLGLHREGCRQAHFMKNGQFHDQMLWGMLIEDWSAQKAQKGKEE